MSSRTPAKPLHWKPRPASGETESQAIGLSCRLVLTHHTALGHHSFFRPVTLEHKLQRVSNAVYLSVSVQSLVPSHLDVSAELSLAADTPFRIVDELPVHCKLSVVPQHTVSCLRWAAVPRQLVFTPPSCLR